MAQLSDLATLQPFYRKRIEESKSVEKMALRMLRQGNSLQSIEGYAYDVWRLAEYSKSPNPDELLGQSRDWVSLINEHLDDFIVRRGASPSAGQRRYSALKRWLTVNDVEVAWHKVEVPKKETVETGQVPRKEELRLICGAANLVDRVLVLVGVSSGLRVGSITKLQLKHLDLKREIPTIKLPKEITKNRKSFLTFISPEAKRVIEAYLKERENRGEVLGPESYLIVKERPRGQPIETRSVQDRWENMLKRVQLYTKVAPGRRWHSLHFHLLRKYYKTWATLSGMNVDVVEYTMGHRSGVKNLYFIPDEAQNVPAEVIEKLEQEYRKAVPALEVMSEEHEIRKLEQSLEEKARDYQNLEQQVKTLNEKLALFESEMAKRKP